jgi:phage terminase large subunit-like protein
VSSLDDAYAKVIELEQYERYNLWRFFDPYPKQKEFMAYGAQYPERMLTAGNQTGKSYAGGYETARHLTGVYPEWWQGLRFDQNKGPCDVWVGGTSGDATRDGAQERLFGKPGVSDLFGSGFIPRDCIVGDPTSSRSATHAIDTAIIKHISGSFSTVQFKTYKQDRTDWQGPTRKFIWFDEEPPEEIYAEGLARLAATAGSHILTFTPLLGYSNVVKRFLEPEPQFAHRRIFVQMALTDALHMTPDMVEATLSMYPRHEWAARRDGNPHMSGGMVFSTPMGQIMEPALMSFDDMGANKYRPLGATSGFEYIWGIDFGIDHPFAAVLMAYERERDTGHIVATVKMSDQLVLQHADAMKRIAENVPVAWPHDGHVRDRQSGEEMADIYRKHGLHMLPEHAQYLNKSYSTEAGIMDLDSAMHANRFRVCETLGDWFAEYRIYHRKLNEKSGVVELVKKNDDLMSATRMAWMQRRSARAVPLGAGRQGMPKRDQVGEIIDPHTGRPL